MYICLFKGSNKKKNGTTTKKQLLAILKQEKQKLSLILSQKLKFIFKILV